MTEVENVKKAHIARVLIILAVAMAAIAAGPRDSLWKQVDEAAKKGLPKTAIAKLEPIIEGAIKEEKWAEAIKAIGRKVALEGNIQGNKPEEKITRMRAEIDQAPEQMKPVMEAILAHWYWHYFQQNRWRFMRRTRTAAPPSEDFTTWDLPRLFDAIDNQFERALAAAETLQETPISEYDELLVKREAPDVYRPTLYDFLVFNALEFYSAGEQAAARPQDAFDLTASGPIFGPAVDFIAWQPETTDEDSPTLKAIRLYQQLLRFHQEDNDRSAWIDADLYRLQFGKNKAFGEETDARYKAALKRFAQRHTDHPISARAIHQLAQVVHGEGDWVRAREIAAQGKARFPNSNGGHLCHNLIQQIQARSSRVSTERVWNNPLPTIDVSYRNVTKIHFRLIDFDFENYVKTTLWSPEGLNREQRRALVAREPLRQWSADLPATEDFQERVEHITPPDDLKPGSYYLLASHNPGFDLQNNHVSFCEVWVSDLALITRNRYGEGVVEGFVLNAISGDPIPGASVRAWHRNSRDNRFVKIKSVKTDKNGLFRLPPSDRRSLLFHAQHGGQELSSAGFVYNYLSKPNRQPHVQTMFFTDRSLYRPGQTIQYKGICLSSHQTNNDYKTLSGRQLTVLFLDVNGQEVERVRHRTNDYGSFSGSVTAPRGRLTGRMTLRVEGEANSQTSINVEEYKRPKFQVTLDAPLKAARLNDQVTLKGKAAAYTGAAVNGANVKWRVVRQVRYPSWWYYRCWWMPPQPSANQEIAHGMVRTAADGGFSITFVAKPDSSVPEESEPTFHYSVYADVTDTAGETRSATRSVNVGYTALSASVSTASWQTDDQPTAITVRTTTLDGVPQAAEGVLRVYNVRQPATVHRARISGSRYYRYRSGKTLTGDPPPPDPENPDSWASGDMVFERPFATDPSGTVVVSQQLPAGMYRAKLETRDRFGKPVTAIASFRVLNPDGSKLNLKLPNLFAVANPTVEPGEDFECLWGSGYNRARAFVEIEHRDQLLQSYWTGGDVTQRLIQQPVNEDMRGGFTVRVTMVRENRAYMNTQRVNRCVDDQGGVAAAFHQELEREGPGRVVQAHVGGVRDHANGRGRRGWNWHRCRRRTQHRRSCGIGDEPGAQADGAVCRRQAPVLSLGSTDGDTGGERQSEGC